MIENCAKNKLLGTATNRNIRNITDEIKGHVMKFAVMYATIKFTENPHD
jgi:hypothetical protein